MHKIAIPQFMVDRVIQLRGKEHCFEDFDPARTALLVVDMQNGFLMPGVAHALCENAQEIVPNINRLARAARAAGATVVWIQAVYREETLTSWSVSYEMAGEVGTQRRINSLTRGNKGWELWPELEARADDLYVEKTRFSAFIQGSSNIEEVLRGRGIDTVLVTGTVTNVCCESTARDAMMRNFRSIMITDGNASFTDEEHNAALTSFYLVFGDIMSTDFAIAGLERNAAQRRRAAE
jgi:ureidoacrylate peracid hydrolase